MTAEQAPKPPDAHPASGGGPRLADLGNEPDDGERISITDVNGTIARFEMSYSPPTGERIVFHPPRSAYFGAVVFLVFGLVLVALEVIAYSGSSNSRLYVWLVEGDRARPMPSAVLAAIVFLSAIGTLARTHLRGVIIRSDGLEARYLMALGLPRVRKWAWPQIHRMIVDEAQVMLELWDGSYEKLPPVADTSKMQGTLERIALGRKIPITRLGKLR